MGFGDNLKFLRKLSNDMTQEMLAEKMDVTRQTISKWEMGGAFPEIEKVIALAELFNCSLDELLRGDMNTDDPHYSHIRVEKMSPIRCYKYAVISNMPEDDAISHVMQWASSHHIKEPKIVGWNFPFVSQEQVNVYHMHGYEAACILPDDFHDNEIQIHTQGSHDYAVITVEKPFENPFTRIPNAYKILMRYIETNQLSDHQVEGVLECFEYEYHEGDTVFMDIYIAL